MIVTNDEYTQIINIKTGIITRITITDNGEIIVTESN